jgi:hypothetical protein
MKKNTKLPSLLLASLAMSFQLAHASSRQASIDLGFERSQAIINALDRFRGDGYKPDNYRIIVNREDDAIEVIFVPRLTSDDPWTAKPSGLPEVHYYLGPSGKSIIRRLLGK